MAKQNFEIKVEGKDKKFPQLEKYISFLISLNNIGFINN